jgi:ABC-type enterobactin transport system permease subunit
MAASQVRVLDFSDGDGRDLMLAVSGCIVVVSCLGLRVRGLRLVEDGDDDARELSDVVSCSATRFV